MSEEKLSEAKKTGSKRTPMPEQSPEIRIRNFDEVPLGYSPEEARAEAARCLKCKKPKCVEGCPVRVDIPGFIKLIEEGDFDPCRAKNKGNKLPARDLRSSLPARVAMRSIVHLGQKRRSRGRRPLGAFRRGL